ncbi:hypothetical protein Barb6_02056 [Bacteroidales bacterium Barb6]|nr:hypothetical protein Barb6_02056 [Bacteroidales bacterium Barb6]
MWALPKENLKHAGMNIGTRERLKLIWITGLLTVERDWINKLPVFMSKI